MCQESNVASTASSIVQSRISKPRSVVFRFGKLLFGFHGFLDIMCVVLTTTAIYHPSLPLSLVIPSQICNLILVNDAYALLNQVTTSTQIFPGVVAPHKEAFQRTIWVMQYLIARVITKFIQQQIQYYSNTRDYSYFSILESTVVLWRHYPLIPQLHIDWWNGNTWIFVIPIFIGVSGDIYVYFVYGDIF